MMPKDLVVGSSKSSSTLTSLANTTQPSSTSIAASQCGVSCSSSNSATAPASPAISNVNSTFYQGSIGASPVSSSTANGLAGFAVHKNSLKSNKLARRARSFKDDLFEKISLMRTPTNTLGRSQSPQSPRAKSQKAPPTAEEVARSSQSLETHVKDISNALKHFRDVVLKRKLEVLPGNGTVILETIASMYAVIQSYSLNENSATLLSAMQQVYQSLAKLIKLCDQVMLCESTNEEEDTPLLSSENVKEIVDLLENAVKNLASLAQQKLREKEVVPTAFPYGIGKSANELSSCSDNNLTTTSQNIVSSILATAPVATMASIATNIEGPGQRTSLPDITLTPKERDVLERNSNNQMRVSYSTESILRETSPPPKPPLPNRCTNPPPLPPKRNNQLLQTHAYEGHNIHTELENSNDFPLATIDHLSVHSRSPDENSSQCSLDSSVNHSSGRDEEHSSSVFNRLFNTINDEFNLPKSSKGVMVDGVKSVGVVGEFDHDTNQTTGATVVGNDLLGTGISVQHSDQITQLKTATDHRHSNESGFISINSFRTSSQCYSKRSSEFSFQSSTKSSNSSTDVAYITTDNNGIPEEYTKYVQQSTKMTSTSTSSTILSSSGKLSSTVIMSFEDGQKQLQFLSGDESTIKAQQSEQLNHNNNPPIKEYSSLSADVYSKEETSSMQSPPALPPKTLRSSSRDQQQMFLIADNFDTTDNNLLCGSNQELAELRHHPQIQLNHYHPLQSHHLQPHQLPQHQRIYQWPSKHTSLIEQRHQLDVPAGSCNTINTMEQLEQPPPLPMKKKHILAYMEICSATTRSVEQHRHTMHAFNLNRNITHSHTMNIVPLAKEEVISPDMDGGPPALPPKSYKQWRNSGYGSTQQQMTETKTLNESTSATPPSSPKNGVNMNSTAALSDQHTRVLGSLTSGDLMSTVCEEELQSNCPFADEGASPDTLENEKPNNSTITSTTTTTTPTNTTNSMVITEDNDKNTRKLMLLPRVEDGSINHLPNIIEEVDVTPYLVFKKDGEDGPEVKGGYIDALIIHASHVQKVTDNAYSEAFITTFRTFIQPIDVIEKLIHRYTVFFCQSNDQKQKSTKETFSLLVRVVNDLTSSDLTGPLLTLLVEFVYQLVCAGQLYLAKLLRNKIVEKVTVYKELRMPAYVTVNEMFFTVTNQPSLLDLKSVEIAEQMTLLDAELFQKIEIPEVLLFAKEQCEEKSPNLNKFTEHFNKMSYWARSKILTLACAKEREKHVIKFIKIMKHLRKMNNYNSYLALLSALDSAPIRRLEWHKTVTDGLKEYCTLIDSSSSFRAYRQALADTQPPCIPYIGLVLQDLTFVHVGNPDCLKEGVINFSKRWQQYNIIDNMKRFKKCAYPFRRNDRIIRFFENFENFLGEEQMWEISETIKPRGKRAIVNN